MSLPPLSGTGGAACSFSSPGFMVVSFAIVITYFDKLAQKRPDFFKSGPADAAALPLFILPRKNAAPCPSGGAYCIRLAVRLGFLYCVLLSKEDNVANNLSLNIVAGCNLENKENYKQTLVNQSLKFLVLPTLLMVIADNV